LDPYTFFTVAAFVFGLVFGSFLNVCIYRMPRGLSVVAPRSACPNCKTPIAAYDNVPVFSWLALRGRCRHCKTPISPRYLGVELLTGVLFAACIWQFSPTPLALKYITLSFLLLGLIFTDCENRLLPDLLTLPGFVLGLIFSLLVPLDGLLEYIFDGRYNWRLLSFGDALLGAFIGAGFVWAAGELYFRMRGVSGMGFGDVKLMAMIGAFLGVRLTVLTIFAASIAGSIFGVGTVLAVWMKRTRRLMARSQMTAVAARKRAWQSAQLVYRNYEMPFGVFLGGMALVALFFGNPFLTWYWRLL